MNDNWVDCITEKQIALLPEVKKFLIYLNKWYFELHILDNKLEVKEQPLFLNQVLQDCYNIRVCNLNTICKDCLVPVDIYYLPYCFNYYQKKHMLHYIIVKEIGHNTFQIFDDNPAYTDSLGRFELERAYVETFTLVKQQLPIIRYDKSTYRSLSLHDELCIFLEQIKGVHQDTSSFLQEIFAINDKDFRASLISDFAMISKKYLAWVNAILHIYELIKLNNLSDYATECFDYFQKWNVIFSLNTKWLILKKESFLERTKNLLRKSCRLIHG